MKIELACCESTLLAEIAMPQSKKKDIAKTYRLAMESSERDSVDWAKVNKAIMKRWSTSGLKRIKSLAWSGKAFSA